MDLKFTILLAVVIEADHKQEYEGLVKEFFKKTARDVRIGFVLWPEKWEKMATKTQISPSIRDI